MPDWRASPSKADMNIHGIAGGVSVETGAVGVDAGYRLRVWRLDTDAAAGATAQENRMLHEPLLSIRWRF